jgi:hypothetical protein
MQGESDLFYKDAAALGRKTVIARGRLLKSKEALSVMREELAVARSAEAEEQRLKAEAEAAEQARQLEAKLRAREEIEAKKAAAKVCRMLATLAPHPQVPTCHITFHINSHITSHTLPMSLPTPLPYHFPHNFPYHSHPVLGPPGAV